MIFFKFQLSTSVLFHICNKKKALAWIFQTKALSLQQCNLTYHIRMYNKRFKKKLKSSHLTFINKYVCNRYNPNGLYKKAYFCKDENIAFVIKLEDYIDWNTEAWGCVNMAHQLLVPFKYQRIFNFGKFLIGKKWNGIDLYNKKGQFQYKIGGLKKTPHKAYMLVYDEEKEYFRISIRKIAISKSLYKCFYVIENGLAFVQNLNNKVGLVLFSKLKLPFEYYAVAVPQNGYTLGIIEVGHKNGVILYDCQLLKVRNQIKKENSIHATGISLFSGKSLEDVKAYFDDKEQFERECNSIVCYNQEVKFSSSSLLFFPYDTENFGKIKSNDYHYEEEEEEEEDYYYNPWENYSYEEALYDALGGEMEAIWNID